ncbi:Fimbrin-5, partial [Astathelohania contejeani]
MSVNIGFNNLKKAEDSKEKKREEIEKMSQSIKHLVPESMCNDLEENFFNVISEGCILLHLISLISKEEKKECFINGSNKIANVFEKRILLGDILQKIKTLGIRLVNIGVEDIMQGNSTPVLGMITQLLSVINKNEKQNKSVLENQQLKNKYDSTINVLCDIASNELDNKMYELTDNSSNTKMLEELTLDSDSNSYYEGIELLELINDINEMVIIKIPSNSEKNQRDAIEIIKPYSEELIELKPIYMQNNPGPIKKDIDLLIDKNNKAYLSDNIMGSYIYEMNNSINNSVSCYKKSLRKTYKRHKFVLPTMEENDIETKIQHITSSNAGTSVKLYKNMIINEISKDLKVIQSQIENIEIQMIIEKGFN